MRRIQRLVQQARLEAYEHRRSLQEVKLTWKLAFKSQPRLPIHAGSSIADATGNPLEVILVDAETGSPWVLPEATLKIELVPLFGDLLRPYDGKNLSWSAEEFRRAIVKPRRSAPLLGCCDLASMRDGRVTMQKELHFTDTSAWVRGRKLRIGARVVEITGRGRSHDDSLRVLEGMTEAFVVGNRNQKHYPPVRRDPVWRLEMIDKDGAPHRNLTSNNVRTVQDFLRMLNVKPHELRAVSFPYYSPSILLVVL